MKSKDSEKEPSLVAPGFIKIETEQKKQLNRSE